jgi:hypothetical protein
LDVEESELEEAELEAELEEPHTRSVALPASFES